MLLGARQFFERRSTPTPPLPYDAEVEYLESTGTQYILSQYKIIAGNIFELDISFVEDSSLGNSSVMVGRNASNNECFIRKNGSGYFGGGSFSSQFSIEYNTRYKMRFDLTAGAMSFTVDDTLLKSSSSTQPDRKQFPLFAVAATAQNNINQIRKARIYSFKSWSGGELVEDWVPVRFTNELGQSEGAMYDRVSGQLFRNAGTGAFLYGRDINPISARSYVNDGLVAMWDGIENAGWGTHDANATTWVDLAGTRNMTLTSTGYWSNNALCKDITSSSTEAAAVDGRLTLATWEYCIKVDDVGHYAQIKVGRYGCFNLAYPYDGAVYCGNDVTCNGFIVPASSNIARGISVSYCNGTLHIDNAASTKNGNTISYSGYSDTLRVLRGKLSGRIFSVRGYSRALTAEEIAANYAIDKARFNLP